MALTNEKIARWIENRFANDYFRFDLICSPIEIINFRQVGNVLEVEYEFWDDGHAYETQQDVLFDLEISKEYDVNFPARMQLVTFKDRYTWTLEEECLSLSENFTAIRPSNTKSEPCHSSSSLYSAPYETMPPSS